MVTGGGGEIGGAICRRLATDGWQVVACDTDLDAATRVCQDIGDEAARAQRLDVTDAEQWEHVLGEIAKHQTVGALVNNVGVSGPVQPLPDYPEHEFELAMRLNVHGAFLGMRAVLPLMQAVGNGAIANIASTSAIRARAHLAGYVASKHAVLGLTRVAALESVGSGVRVNAVLPGPIDTRMIDHINAGNQALSGGDVKRSASAAYGSVEDVATTVGHLVSPEAAHVNGAAWVVDGGSTLA